jgi:hypothetical protein
VPQPRAAELFIPDNGPSGFLRDADPANGFPAYELPEISRRMEKTTSVCRLLSVNAEGEP